MHRHLAEVEGGFDQDPQCWDAGLSGHVGTGDQRAHDVADDVLGVRPVGHVDGSVRGGSPPVCETTAPAPGGGRDVHELGVVAGPRVVDQVQAHGGAAGATFRTPGIEAEHEVGAPRARLFGNGRTRSTSSAAATSGPPSPAARPRRRRCRRPRRPPGRGRPGGAEVGVPVSDEERVGGAVDDGHDRRPRRVVPPAAQEQRGGVSRWRGVTGSVTPSCCHPSGHRRPRRRPAARGRCRTGWAPPRAASSCMRPGGCG